MGNGLGEDEDEEAKNTSKCPDPAMPAPSKPKSRSALLSSFSVPVMAADMYDSRTCEITSDLAKTLQPATLKRSNKCKYIQ